MRVVSEVSFSRQRSEPIPRSCHRKDVDGNGANEKSASMRLAFARKSKFALNMKKIASINAIRRTISVGQILIPEKKVSGSWEPQYCATKATRKTMSGTPQTSQNVVLTSARFRR